MQLMRSLSSHRIRTLHPAGIVRQGHVHHGCHMPRVQPRRAIIVGAAAPNEPGASGSSKSAMPQLPPRRKSKQSSSPTAEDSPQPAAEGTADTSTTTSSSSSSSSNSGTSPKPNSTSSNSNSNSRRLRPGRRLGGMSSPDMPPPLESPQALMQERALAGLLAYTGLMGTVATAISYFVPELDLFGNFHWDAADVTFALKLMVPVYLMNIAILLPSYSSWQLPQVTPESQQQMAEALAKWSSNKAAKGGSSAGASSGSAKDSSKAAAEGAAGPAAATSTVDAAAAGPEPEAAGSEPGKSAAVAAEALGAAADVGIASSNSNSTGQPAAPAAASASSSSSSAASEEDRVSGPLPWLSQQLQSRPVTRMKDALFLAQGHYLSLNPAIVLPPAVQITVLLADCLAAELLYRSVALQLAGGWISDRMYEAGAEDFLHLATAGLPVLPTHMAGQLAAIALLSGAWGVTVLQRMSRMSRRPVMMLGVQGRQAAGQLLEDLSRTAGQKKRQQQQQQDEGNDSSSSSSSNASTSLQDYKPNSSDASSSSQPDAQEQQQQQQQQPASQKPASQAAADLATAAAAAEQAASNSAPVLQQKPDTQQQQPGVAPSNADVAVPEPQWSRRLPSTLNALALSQLVQGVRDVSQMTALGLGFVLTGNLAAPFAAAVVNQLLMAALQKHGIERARQRSIAMAKQLAGLTRSLRDIQRRQMEAKRNKEQQQQGQQGEGQQQLAATSTAEGAAGPAAPSTAAHSSGSSSETVVAATAIAAAAGLESAAATAAPAGSMEEVGEEEVSGPVVLAASAAGECGTAGPDPADSKSLINSRMEQTINVLDQLLGELGQHATAGPGSGE